MKVFSFDKTKFWVEKSKFVMHNDIKLVKEKPVSIDSGTKIDIP